MSPKKVLVDAGEIKRLYVEEGWSRRRIAKHVGVSDWTVVDRLTQLGIAVRPMGVLNDEAARDEVVATITELYLKKGMKIEEIAPHVHVRRLSVSRVLKDAGIQVPRRPERDLNEILRLYHDLGWRAARIAKHFGCTEKSIFHDIMKSGSTRRSRRPKLDPVKIKEMYVDQELPQDKIAAHFQTGRRSIIKVLRDQGIEIRTRDAVKKRRSRFSDPRLADLEIGESFSIQCLDPATPRSYFFKMSKKMNIQIATQMVGSTELQITRVA